MKVASPRLIESNQHNSWCLLIVGVEERRKERTWEAKILHLSSDVSCVNYQEVTGNSIWLNTYLATKVDAEKIYGSTLSRRMFILFVREARLRPPNGMRITLNQSCLF